MTSPMPMQRVGPVAEIPDLVSELGVSPDQVLASVGMSRADLDPDNYIRFDRTMQLLGACEQAAARSDFGLQLGMRSDHRSLGLIAQVMEFQSTLGAALADYIRVQVGLSQGAVAYCIPSGDDVAFGFGMYDRKSTLSAQLYGLSMAVAANIVRRISGETATILEIQFCHRKPDSWAEYARRLQARVLFDQAQSCVVFPRSAMDAPNPHADVTLLRKAQDALQKALQLDVATTGTILRHQLRPLITRGDVSLLTAARALGIGPRTLNRLLAKEGTTFRAELDLVRHTMACEFLELTDLRIGEIAVALDFGTHAAFDEAFLRWSGQSPTDWRKARGAGSKGVAS